MRDILLVKLNGLRYGIWNDEVASVREPGMLHRFPLSPACIAGISLIDDRTVTIADLSVCVGMGPAAPGEKRRILLLKTGEKPTGFLIDAEIVTRSVSDDDVLPVPEYLRTDGIPACVIQDAVPVPIIDAAFLYSHFLRGTQDALRPPLAVSPVRESLATAIQLLAIDQVEYGFLSGGSEEPSIRLAGAREFPFAPSFVRGITLHRNEVVPVIDLSQRIRGKRAGDAALMIPHRAGDALFALLVDENRGRLDISEQVIAELPLLARTSWIVSATLHEGVIIPLVDVEILLAAREGDAEEGLLSEQYALHPGFPGLFRTQAVEVLEFSFFGTRHALPKSEVEDIIPFRSCRSIPETRDIVLGVVEHSGKLLPVLDLAAVFGRRSHPDSEWSMILVRNGDFRAFVITDTVYGERHLEADVQRELPLNLPHQVVYGCYPDADAVRLILNIASIAINFEESLVRELLPVLSPEMRHVPPEVISAPLEGKERAAIAVEPLREEVSAQPDMAARYQETPAVAMAGSRQGIEPMSPDKQRDLFRDETPAAIQDESVVEAVQVQETPERTTALPPFPETIAVPEADSLHAEEPATPVADADAKAAQEERVEVKSEAVPHFEQPAPEVVQSVPSVISALSQSRALPVTEAKPITEPGPGITSTPEPELAQAAAPVPAPVVTAQKPDQKATETKPASDIFERPAPVQLNIPYPESQPDQVRTRPELPEHATPVWKRRMAYAGIAVLLALLIFILPRSGPRNPENRADKAALPRVEQDGTAEKARSVETMRKQAEHSEPPLVLDIPRETPVITDVYVVIEGDTLWSISERFTGNPFNFPRIAGENRIANPDLIFPGQRIRLQKKS